MVRRVLVVCSSLLPACASPAPEPASSSASQEAERSIGVARMLPDRTIELRLRAEDPATSAVGEALLRYPPTHPDYARILEHVGPMEPGDERSVAPFPE